MYNGILKMNILIDAATLYQKDCGSKTYTYNILKELLALTSSEPAPSIDVCGVSGKIINLTGVSMLDEIAYKKNGGGLAAKLKKSIPQDSFFYPYAKSFYRNIKKSINKINIYFVNKKGKAYDVFFTPYQMEINANIAKRKFITIHDIYALTSPENYLTKSYTLSFKKYLEKYLGFFDAVLTVSEFAKNEIAGYLNYPKEKIFVVRGAFDKKNYRKLKTEDDYSSAEAFKKKYGLKKPYLLYVGVLEPRKNIANLLKAFKELTGGVREGGGSERGAGNYRGRFDLDLVLVSGSSALAAETFKLAEELSPRVKIFKGVGNEDLNFFYNYADLFVFPSLYEGFGIPPLEAFACGTPVAASNATAIPEICGNGAYYFDPHSVESIKNAVSEVLSSPSIKSGLIENGFKTAETYSFRNSAVEMLNIFKNF